jgi:hypothetical protein
VLQDRTNHKLLTFPNTIIVAYGGEVIIITFSPSGLITMVIVASMSLMLIFGFHLNGLVISLG